MPLFKQIKSPDFEIAIWKIEEDESFFEPFFKKPDFTLVPRRLQWYATRYLAKQFLGESSEIHYDENGKPIVKGEVVNISISHTSNFAGLMWSKTKEVGLDIENITPKVIRIASKFMEEEEIEAMREEEKMQKLTLCWSAKESLYKWFAKGSLEFRTQLRIQPFGLDKQGKLEAIIKLEDEELPMTIPYEFFENVVLSYTAK